MYGKTKNFILLALLSIEQRVRFLSISSLLVLVSFFFYNFTNDVFRVIFVLFSIMADFAAINQFVSLDGCLVYQSSQYRNSSYVNGALVGKMP